MYARCGALSRAKALFLGILPLPCVFAWSAIMAGYVAYGYHKEALTCFEHMKLEGNICLHSGACSSSLKACAKTGNIVKGQEIHIDIVKRELLEGDQILCNSLIHMYAQNGWFLEAKQVFEEVQDIDVVSWGALMTGFVKYGHMEETLKCLPHMRIMGISPDSVVLICCLKACSNIGDVERGREMHLETSKMGLLVQRDASLGNALLDLYANCGRLLEARDVLDKLRCRDVVSWTALISGYTKYGHCKEALESFRKMNSEGISANAVSFLCILKACASANATREGQEIHAEIEKKGLLERNTSLGNTLVRMYADCGLLIEAQEIFNHLPIVDAVSWTALMGGYTRYGYGEKALNCFNQMQNEGLFLDAIAYVCCLSACASLEALDQGRKIHAKISCNGFMITHLETGNTLIGMYAKCGMLTEAQKVFNDLPVQDTISWNAMIAGYAKHERGEEAFYLLEQMQQKGIPFDVVTLVCGVKTCGRLGASQKGEKLHDEISRRGLLEKDSLVGNALIEMYAECGLLPKAHQVFEEIPLRDIVSWTLLITGYAQLGETNQVFFLFDRMREDITQDPNLITFVGVLTACSHGGLLKEGEKLFDDMCFVYYLSPTVEHYACMIDLFGRAGYLDKAQILFNKVSYSDHLLLLLAILGACHKWVNVKLGRWAFAQAVELDKNCAAAYACMENIYIAAGMHMEMNEIEFLR